ncbi:MAG TPA: hypothetical protein VFB42_03675 [Gaiellaceae bacterium]|nr:hypothetical protein [Gaiellaceae bacterium]
MDRRLIPLNGLIALLRGDGRWPSLLRNQGWERHQFEMLVSTSSGDIRADAVLFRTAPALVLLAECKSGKNLEEEQARRYLAADATALRRAGTLPSVLRDEPDVAVRAMFVGLEDERAALEHALRALEIEAPLLTIGSSRVRLSGSSGVTGLDDFDQRHDGGLPPARFPVDHQSPDDEIQELLVPQLTAAQARGLEFLGIESLCEALLPEWALLGRGVQQSFIQRCETILRRLTSAAMRRYFRYEPRTGSSQGRVVILSTPAALDPRGATRAWQAAQGRAARSIGRQPQPQIEGQLSLEDLAETGGIAEE